MAQPVQFTSDRIASRTTLAGNASKREAAIYSASNLVDMGAGFPDELAPAVLLAGDQRRELGGAAAHGLHAAFVHQALADFGDRQRAAEFGVQPLDDRGGRRGRRDDAEPGLEF